MRIGLRHSIRRRWTCSPEFACVVGRRKAHEIPNGPTGFSRTRSAGQKGAVTSRAGSMSRHLDKFVFRWNLQRHTRTTADRPIDTDLSGFVEETSDAPDPPLGVRPESPHQFPEPPSPGRFRHLSQPPSPFHAGIPGQVAHGSVITSWSATIKKSLMPDFLPDGSMCRSGRQILHHTE